MKSAWIQCQVLGAGVLFSICAMAQTAPTSRDEVTQELARARAAGEMDYAASEVMGPAAITGASGYASLTRSQVVAELVRARAAGEMDFAQQEVQLPLPAGRVMSRPLMAEAPAR
jgi:hypothetical protein